MAAPLRRDPALLVSGLIAVLGNVLGVLFLKDVPGAYRVAQLEGWARDSLLHPQATAASAISFVVGLLGLAVWALSLGRRVSEPGARAGAWFVAGGALLNAAGCVTPLVLALHVGDTGEAGAPLARALLGITLSLDAAFNLTLGVGLLALGLCWRASPRRWLRGLAIVAGAASLPVAGQAISDGAADFLLLAAPLWLGFILVTSLRGWSDDGAT